MPFSTLALQLPSGSDDGRARALIADATQLGARRVRLIDHEGADDVSACALADGVCDAGLRWVLDTAGGAERIDALARCPRRREHCAGVIVRVDHTRADQGESATPVAALACMAATQAYDVPFSLSVRVTQTAAARVDAIAYEAAQLGAEGVVFECLTEAGLPGGTSADFRGLAERIDALNAILRIEVCSGASVPRHPLGPECAPFAFEELAVDHTGQGRWCERIDGQYLGTATSSLADIAREAISLRPAAAAQRAARLGDGTTASPCSACRAALAAPSCHLTDS